MPRPLHSASAPGRGRELSRKRRRWEELYRTGDPHQFRWLEDEVPPHLLELLRRRDLVDGAALDIGCGPGTITMTLATRFRPTVGLDLSLAAVTRARAQPVPRDGVRPSFLVAAAPDMPFPDGLFSFVFDRGCLQALPVREWPVYLERVAHLLKPGGIFQLYASRPRPPLVSLRRTKAAARRLLDRRPKISLPDRLRRLAPPGLVPVEVHEYEWSDRIRRQEQTYALFRKR